MKSFFLQALDTQSSSYLGCYVDTSTSHDLTYQYVHVLISQIEVNMLTSKLMTIEYCVDICYELGYMTAGLQDGLDIFKKSIITFSKYNLISANCFFLTQSSMCFCGNLTYGVYGLSASCNTPCIGNSSQICGGLLVNSIYNTVFYS